MAALSPEARLNYRGVVRTLRFSTVLRWLLVVAFAWSGGGKLFWPAAFQEALAKLGMLPTPLIPLTAYTLPGLELLIAAGLATQRVRLPAACAALFFSAVFLGVHGYATATGTLVPCGCAGVALRFDSREFHLTMLAVSSLMLLASFLVVMARPPGTSR